MTLEELFDLIESGKPIPNRKEAINLLTLGLKDLYAKFSNLAQFSSGIEGYLRVLACLMDAKLNLTEEDWKDASEKATYPCLDESPISDTPQEETIEISDEEEENIQPLEEQNSPVSESKIVSISVTEELLNYFSCPDCNAYLGDSAKRVYPEESDTSDGIPTRILTMCDICHKEREFTDIFSL